MSRSITACWARACEPCMCVVSFDFGCDEKFVVSHVATILCIENSHFLPHFSMEFNEIQFSVWAPAVITGSLGRGSDIGRLRAISRPQQTVQRLSLSRRIHEKIAFWTIQMPYSTAIIRRLILCVLIDCQNCTGARTHGKNVFGPIASSMWRLQSHRYAFVAWLIGTPYSTMRRCLACTAFR